ncbi:MAG: DUF1800 family protein [Planctomycetota bacterium]
MSTTFSRRSARRVLAAPLALVCALPVGAQTLDVRLEDGGHILRRTSYGVSTSDIVNISFPLTTPQSQIISAYLAAQIGPNAAVENPELDALLNGPTSTFTVPFLLANDPGQTAITWSVFDLAETNIARACMSSNQLQELMVNFWEEHFSTNFWSEVNYFEDQNETRTRAEELGAYFEWRENQFFRENWHHDFEDLLLFSAKSATMLIYLDNVDNTANGPNENYSRELLELHTLGVDPNTGQAVHYDLTDIIELSKILTGWTLVKDPATLDWRFDFDGSAAGHSAGNKTLTLGSGPPFTAIYDNAAPTEGELALQHIANLPETAEFVSRKLYKLFISDTEPPPGDPLIAACVADWTANNGQIKRIVDLLLRSPEFQSDTNIRWTMARTPLESVGQMVRGSGGTFLTEGQVQGVRDDLDNELGQQLFRFPSPDGFPGASLDQISTAGTLNRIRFNQKAYSQLDLMGTIYAGTAFYNPIGVLDAFGVDKTSEIAVADWFLLVFFQGNLTPLDTAFAHDFILRDSAGNPTATNFAALLATQTIPDLQEYADRLNSFLAYIQSFEQSQSK